MGTGRSGSSHNGMIERPNRTITNIVCAKLLNAGLCDKFWYFAAEYTNFKLYRMLHTATQTTLYKAWTGNIPDFADMKIWGCHVYILNPDVTYTKLDNHTYVGLFIKFSSTTKIIVYYNPKKKKFGQTSHAYLDELHICKTVTTEMAKLVPGKNLISTFSRIPCDITLSDIKLNISCLHILKEPTITYETILPSVEYVYPIKFYDDDTYGLLYVKIIPASTPIWQQLPNLALKQQWLLSIGTEEPIHHSISAHDELTRLRTTHVNKMISITLAPIF